MNILFLHRNFPGQFKYLIKELAQNPRNNVFFITNNDKGQIEGVKKIVYTINEPIAQKCIDFLESYEESLLHAKSAAVEAEKLKSLGFKPDIIYGHSWGPTTFMKSVFPDVPLICYFEWFYKPEEVEFAYPNKKIDAMTKSKIRCKNSNILMDLYSCDAGISPTNWQKSQFPAEFQKKIKVIHDGVDADTCKPDKGAKFLVADKNLELSTEDEVITYVSRGFEDYRGFPQFMMAVNKLLKNRPNCHVVIAGNDIVYYGRKIIGTTYKKIMLEQLNIDLSRVHFVDFLSFNDYVRLLQISSVHVYLTYPFVLSWSLLEAMAVGCSIVGSNTETVKEVIQDNFNGLLADFYNVNELVYKIEYLLNNRNIASRLSNNARQTIIDKYDLKILLNLHIKMIDQMLF